MLKRACVTLVFISLLAACGDGAGDTTTSVSLTAGPTDSTDPPATTTSHPGTSPPSTPWMEEDVTFAFGEEQLFGILTLPDEPGPHPAIVIVRGSGQGGVSSRYYTDHARTWALDGYATLRYDPPGIGQSTGAGGFQSLEQRSEEVMAAVRLLQSRDDISPERVGLWGESQGGWVIAMTAADHPDDIAFIVSVSGSGVSVAEQQVYNIEAESRAAGFSDEDIARAGLFGRLLIDWQLTDPVYRQANEEAAQALGSGPWDDFAALVYEPGDLTPAENLQAGISILTAIQDEPWAVFLRLRDLYIPLLASIPPDQIGAVRAATGPDLVRDPGDSMTKIVCPVLAFFGEDDVVQPTERSAALYAQYLTEAGNEDVEIVVIPGVGHNIDLSIPEYADALAEWLADRFGGIPEE